MQESKVAKNPSRAAPIPGTRRTLQDLIDALKPDPDETDPRDEPERDSVTGTPVRT